MPGRFSVSSALGNAIRTIKPKRSQISAEYILILGMVLLVTIPLFYYAITKSNSSIRLNQADDAINSLAKAADTVYAIGPGTKRYVWIAVPSGVESTAVYDNTIQLNLQIFRGISELTRTATPSLIGAIPHGQGTYKIAVEALESGYVQIGQGNDTAFPEVVWTDPTGVICNSYVVLKANTNEPAGCRFDTTDSSYFNMSYAFVGSSLTHQNIMGIQSEGGYRYYVRCQDVFGNAMDSSAVLSYILNQTTCGEGGNGTGELYEQNPPVVHLISPYSGYISNSSLVSFKYNATDESAIAFCELALNNTIRQTGANITKGITQEFQTLVDFGNYAWYVNCTDVHGNENSSELRNIIVNATLDSDLPVVSLVAPLNNTVRDYWLVKFSYNVTDNTSNINYCSLNLQGALDSNSSVEWSITDTPVAENTTESLTLPLFKGNYTWGVNCVDSSVLGNIGNSELRNLRVNITAGEGAFLDSCRGYCGYNGYSSGACVQNCGGACSGKCEPGGNIWCPGTPTPECCCYY